MRVSAPAAREIGESDSLASYRACGEVLAFIFAGGITFPRKVALPRHRLDSGIESKNGGTNTFLSQLVWVCLSIMFEGFALSRGNDYYRGATEAYLPDALRKEIFFQDVGDAEQESAVSEFSDENFLVPEGNTWKRVIIVSNRLPFNITHTEGGKLVVQASSGGLVTAMSPLLRERNGVSGKWIGWPGAPEEEGLEEALRTAPNGPSEVGAVYLTAEEESQYYQGYSNEVLCPLFEGDMYKVDFEKADAHWPVYRRVQKKFAQKIREELSAGDIVWIHDYHLAGVGQELRTLGVEQPIGYFLHMPFPNEERFSLLPHREEFLQGLLAYDIVGFQTEMFKQNFIRAVEAYVPEAVIEKTSDTITSLRIGARRIRVGNFPISIDSEEFLEQAAAPETQERARELEKTLRKDGRAQVIFNAGRLDYTKGFYEELLAFDRLLEKHPELIGELVLCQLVIPSRESIPAYQEYKKKIIELARWINKKYKTRILPDALPDEDGFFEAYADMPVRQIHGHMDRPLYLAHLRVADIQSVPTKADGMNLVSKEGAVVGKDTMVQILGKEAGVVEEIGPYVLLVNPENIESFADILYRAYTMSAPEKRERKQHMTEMVIGNNVFQWWSKQEPIFQQVWNEKIKTPENAREFLEKLRNREAIEPNSSVAVVVAHQDDEVIGFGAQFSRFPGCTVIHVTDGAPADPREWKGLTRAQYAALREKEMNAALTLAGQTGSRESLGVADQGVAFMLAETARKLAERFEKNDTKFVLTHAYEGGHPDHDGVAFAVHAAKKLLEMKGRTLQIIEAPFYRVEKEGAKNVRQSFVPARSSETATLPLNEAEQDLKKKLYEAHASQRGVLSTMSTTTEWLREASDWDFNQLPNEGKLSHIFTDAGIGAETWTALTGQAHRALGIVA